MLLSFCLLLSLSIPLRTSFNVMPIFGSIGIARTPIFSTWLLKYLESSKSTVRSIGIFVSLHNSRMWRCLLSWNILLCFKTQASLCFSIIFTQISFFGEACMSRNVKFIEEICERELMWTLQTQSRLWSRASFPARLSNVGELQSHHRTIHIYAPSHLSHYVHSKAKGCSRDRGWPGVSWTS